MSGSFFPPLVGVVLLLWKSGGVVGHPKKFKVGQEAEARGKRQEARGRRQEVRGKRKEATSKRLEARG